MGEAEADQAQALIVSGVLVQPLSRQDDHSDMGPLDPEKVEIDFERDYPVTIGFDEKRLVGTAKLRRSVEGAIMAEVNFDQTGLAQMSEFERPLYLAIGAMMAKDPAARTTFTPYSASIVKHHADLAQPPFEVPDA